MLKNSIALIGGGPAALFMLKHIIASKLAFTDIYIFEKNDRLGVGMPYGKFGSKEEHVANVSADEVPPLYYSVHDFLENYNKHQDQVSEIKEDDFKVIPRLVLGDYLEKQFQAYIKQAKKNGAHVHLHLETSVRDLISFEEEQLKVVTDREEVVVNAAVICTGHYWEKTYEDQTPGWYDSPYPPRKFSVKTNFPVAVRGASLTAVDAIKTISRLNGKFEVNEDGRVKYILNEDSPNFKIDMFSIGGYLPALRFYTEDEAYSPEWTLSLDEIFDYKQKHGGFVDLDYVFNKNFKEPLKARDKKFYEEIKDLSIEEFVERMMNIRKELDSFQLLKAEYQQAEKSIKRHESISWKETLSAFSYAMNYPAKHFSAEDMIRLRKTLMPLISIIIASLPQSSYVELIALYDAGILSSIAVDLTSKVEPDATEGALYTFKNENGETVTQHYRMFIDAIGQKPMVYEDVPFPSLVSQNVVTPGYLEFRDPEEGEKLHANSDPMVLKNNDHYYYRVKGIAINDYFQPLDSYGSATENIFVMAVPLIGGLNPDYSGLDFCDTAAERIATRINSII